MNKQSSHQAQAGITQIGVILIIVAVIVVAVAVFFLMRSGNDSNKNNQNTSEGPTLNERNVSRQTDASKLLAAAAEFSANNNGALPTTFVGGVLSGGTGTKLSGVELEIYKSVSVVQGEQTGVTSDELRLVTGATCGEDGATVVGSSQAVVAQYSQEKSDGSFTGACQEQ